VDDMTTYSISNRSSGFDLGIYNGSTADDAVNAMYMDAGYRDAQHAADVLETTVETLRSELVVTEVDVTITALAASMVVLDRDSGDCVTDDGKADHWDLPGIRSAGEAADIDAALAAMIWQQYPHLVRAAYARAWRAAVAGEVAS
jgi:hypothetical protein